MNHLTPSTVRAPAPNHLTLEGALALAERIEQYWIRRGYDNVVAGAYPVPAFDGTPAYGIRSNVLECIRAGRVNAAPWVHF
ncbi:MAG: hypothetical protein HXX10_07585 [Rhodoplanes sp.]|uniref:hypothetical protein n=1 Tax=Rhodoplanes sp. TaxID=1968906 RepID=UPI001839E370|nr:hypothetical protein [Rhodoplanes sp.]NVO13882.1 hypothetical protein [Rhodoplanes sp.]